ncbi:MAG: VF530 family DNA-binding protein [Congregibacter sp.]
MNSEQPRNPLHGITLEMVVRGLVDRYGWEGLAQRIDIKCFRSEPSVKSSLTFLRRTQWARDKVERLYIKTFDKSSPWDRVK